ncbi:MAG: ImmA/IrrE family metallo-endopeptidase [Thermodesulfobacteriota bacterium]
MAGRVPLANPRSGDHLERMALKVIQGSQPHLLKEAAPFDIEEFFEFDVEDICGVRIDYRSDLPDGVYGYTDSEERLTVISSELMEDPRQRRFCRSTMAHEAGHALIHVPEFRLKKAFLRSIHDEKHVSLRLYREAEIKPYMNPEWQAWRFAGALMMPARPFTDAVLKGCDVGRLADLFQVNPAFVKARGRALKMTI